MEMGYNYQQGTYKIKNWDKYRGVKNPRYLSSYEYSFFRWADRCPYVLEWGAETVIVEYYNPIKQRKARYIVDVYIKFKDKHGEIREELIEIKPSAQFKPPKKGRKRQDVYEREIATYLVNCAKWEAAQHYAKKRNMNFRVVTEKSIFH